MKCEIDDCDQSHCPRCGSHTLGRLEQGQLCSTCEQRDAEPAPNNAPRESLEDVKRLLEMGVTGMFVFDRQAIEALNEASLDGHEATRNKCEVAAQRLQNRLDLYKPKIDGDYVMLDAFSISAVLLPHGESLASDGVGTQVETVPGFLVEVAKPIHSGSRDIPDDVDLAEVGTFTNAAAAAQKVIELITLDNLNRFFEGEALALEEQDRERQAEEVF